MPCAVLTVGVLEAARERRLTAEERARVLRHLQEPCEGCLDLLERWPVEELLLSTEDALSPEERERVFSTASGTGATPARMQPTGPRWARRRLSRLALGAAIAAMLVGVVTALHPPRRQLEEGLKGPASPTAVLIPLVGARTPQPHVVRALPRSGTLAPGEFLLLRIQLDAPGWVTLLWQEEGKPAEPLWPSGQAVRREAGEFELTERGSALAIEAGAFSSGARLLLVACPDPIDPGRPSLRDPVRTREELERAFPGCGVDLLTVGVEAR